jgi:hypothetical protein
MRPDLSVSTFICMIRDSAVGIATGYGLDYRGSEFESLWGQEFSCVRVVQTGSGVHPSSYPVGGEADHSPPASAVKKMFI